MSMVLDVAAIVLGLLVAIGVAQLAAGQAEQRDGAMIWEGRVAVGFAGLVVLGPVLLVQVILTVVASVVGGGVWPGWLWVWLFAAPAVGLVPPFVRPVRALVGIFGGRRRHHADSRRSVAAVQQSANTAWADLGAATGWELRRTPPLPHRWPPSLGGPAVWFCYAERTGAPAAIEVAGPFARITLGVEESAWPVIERLTDRIESVGSQGVEPVVVDRSRRGRRSLLDAIYQGDPDGHLAGTLSGWRALNGRIAAHPTVAPHLPP